MIKLYADNNHGGKVKWPKMKDIIGSIGVGIERKININKSGFQINKIALKIDTIRVQRQLKQSLGEMEADGRASESVVVVVDETIVTSEI